jgi:hypothetical protein
MDIRSPLVPDRQSPVARQPGQGPLDHPAVPAQPLARLDALARDPHLDPAAMEEPSTARDVVRLVGMELGRALAPLPGGLADRGHGVDQVREDHAVMAVRPGEHGGQRDALALRDEMLFRARLAAIGWVRSHRLAPLLAGTLVLSRLARAQSIRSASPSRSSRVRCSRSQTPTCCQSCKRRQQVTPEPQPISWGSSSHRIPLLSTKMIPVSAARSGTRGRPPLSVGDSTGSSGPMIAQSSSETRGLLMRLVYHSLPLF